jgi:CheY-like chemotaxis protein
MVNMGEEITLLRSKLSQSDMLLQKLNNSVRGPLYSVMELARIALNDNLSPDQTADYLAMIERSGRTMNESIDDIMALRQIYMNEVHIHPLRIYIIDLLNRLKSDLEKSLDNYKTSFNVSDDKMMDTAILVDYTALLQVCRKFSKNSGFMSYQKKIDFIIDKVSEDAGSITLKLSMSFSEFSLTSTLVDGLTMPYKTIQSNIEKGCCTIDSSCLIIRYYLHAMGTDTIDIENESNGSTVVSINLSFPIVSRKDFAKLDLDSIDFTGKRILVADDDNVNLKVIEKLLLEKNAEFVTVRDGKEALYTFRDEHGRFDLILMDIIMPDMSGLDVTRKIRQTKTLPNAKSIPIIAMTVSALDENYYESKAAGMNAHLVKPIEPERLYATIAEYLGYMA